MNSSWPWSRLRWTQPGQPDLLADVGRAQLAAVVGAIGMHRAPVTWKCKSGAGAKGQQCRPTVKRETRFASARRAPMVASCKRMKRAHDVTHQDRRARRALRRAGAGSRSSPSTPSSCAIAPTSRSCAWCRSRARGATPRSTRWRRASISRRLLALMTNPAVVKVFHAARQDVEIFHHLGGAIPTPLFDTQLAAMVCGYRRGGRLRDPGRTARQGADRQELALHRLVAPAADQAAARLCAGRRHPSARGLPAPRGAAAADRAQRLGRPGAGRPHRSAHLRAAARGRLAADQAALARAALPGDRAGAGGMARARGAAARSAAQPHPARRPAARARRQPAALDRRHRQAPADLAWIGRALRPWSRRCARHSTLPEASCRWSSRLPSCRAASARWSTSCGCC